MKKILLLLSGIALYSLLPLIAQSFINADDELVNGYSLKISGTDFEYHSCIPGLRQSILVRVKILGADVTGKHFQDSEQSIGPLESKFFLIRTDFQESGK
jgi:hypothetical protein